MEIKELLNTIDTEKLDFSLLVVSAKPPFIKWLEDFKAHKYGPRFQNHRIHFSEEDSVWIIPNLNQFHNVASLQENVKELKPKMLLWEVTRYGAKATDFGDELTKETFDKCFSFGFRRKIEYVTPLISQSDLPVTLQSRQIGIDGMDIVSLCQTINIAKGDFSLLMVSLGSTYLKTASNMPEETGGKESGALDQSVDYTTLILPKLERFSMPGAIGDLLKYLKLKIVKIEKSRNPKLSENMNYALDLTLRDGATAISHIIN